VLWIKRFDPGENMMSCPAERPVMVEGTIPAMVSAQLGVIEVVWEIRFVNRGDICGWIAGMVRTERQVLTVTSAVNNWIALSGRKGDVYVAKKEFGELTRAVRW
jgi:hypothetical protein